MKSKNSWASSGQAATHVEPSPILDLAENTTRCGVGLMIR